MSRASDTEPAKGGGGIAGASGGGGSDDGKFSSHTISVRAQKKLIGRLASKSALKIFLDSTSARLLDELYRVVKLWCDSRQAAKRLMKQVVKINMKIGVLYLNNVLNDDEKAMAEEFRDLFSELAETAVRTFRRERRPDIGEAIGRVQRCEDLVLRATRRHLSEKSLRGVRTCAAFFSDRSFLEALLDPDSRLAVHMAPLCEGVQELLDRGVL